MTDWTQAACRGQGPQVFFDWETTRSPSLKQTLRHRAMRFCARCPITEQCLEFALSERLTGGIYGGLDDEQRTAILDERRVVLNLQVTLVARQDGVTPDGNRASPFTTPEDLAWAHQLARP